MSELKFSVIIPTCDRPEFLLEAVESVLAQKQPAHEILIIDNGRDPVDPSRLQKSKKIQLVRALPRFGVSQARNLGAVLASGNYISFLDDDDRWDKEYLHSVHLTVEENGAEIVLGRLRDKETGTPIKGKQAAFHDREDLIHQIMLRNPGAGGSNTTVARAAFGASTGYDPWMPASEDKALLLDLLLTGARPARASNAWVDIRSNSQDPHLSEIANRIQGKNRFLKKYWSQMNGYQRLFNLVQIVRLRLGHWFGVY